MDVMRFGTSVSDEFVADEERERQVRQTAAMQMAELAMSVSELGAAKPMPAGGDPWPRRDLPNDGVVDGAGHSTLPFNLSYCPARKMPRG
jgi:hypothetical protein